MRRVFHAKATRFGVALCLFGVACSDGGSRMDGTMDSGIAMPDADVRDMALPDAEAGMPEPDAGEDLGPDDMGVDMAPDAGGPTTPVCLESAPPADTSAGSWSDGFTLPGVVGPVETLVGLPSGEVVIGGELRGAGSLEIMNVVAWDGLRFRALGDGLPGMVFDLAVDGSGQLHALWQGPFDPFTGEIARVLSRWDGTRWEEMATLPPAAGVLETDVSGELLVAGAFDAIGGIAAASLARWDGTAFNAVHPDGVDGGIEAVLADERGICVGGLFGAVGALETDGVACLVGGSWEARSLRPFFMVNSLARDDDGSLIAGGHFALEDGDVSGSIARWTGSGWEYVGGGVAASFGFGYVETVLVAAGEIHAGGRFIRAGSVPAVDVARWDGTRWDGMGGGLPKTGFGVGLESVNVRDSVAMPDGSLYFGGQFSFAGGRTTFGVAKWDGEEWEPLREQSPGYIGGINGAVQALASEGTCGLYVGGSFDVAGDVEARNVAQLVSGGWQALGEGLAGGVASLLATERRRGDGSAGLRGDFGDGTGPLVVAGLQEDRGMGGVHVFDGESWTPLGRGPSGAVADLALQDDGSLVAGGRFDRLRDGSAAGAAARWDGTAWEALATSVEGAFAGELRSVVVDPADGSLIVTGNFARIDGVRANGIARLREGTWEPVGDGLEADQLVEDAIFHEGALFVSGWFDRTGGGTAAPNVVRLAGGSFEAVGAPAGVFAGKLTSVGGGLFAAGIFERGDGTFASDLLLRFDGRSWTAVGDQPGDLVQAMAVYDGALYTGGVFTRFGGTTSFAIGRLDFPD